MIQLFSTKIGRLRLLGFLEGLSLLFLLFVAVPMKYIGNDPSFTKLLGPIHGAIFVWFLLSALSLGVEQQWKFKTTTWKIIVACFIPFGTFYIDYLIFRNVKDNQ